MTTTEIKLEVAEYKPSAQALAERGATKTPAYRALKAALERAQ